MRPVTKGQRSLFVVPPLWEPFFERYSQIMPLEDWETFFSTYSDSLSIIPEDWRELFFQYLVLAETHSVVNEKKWKDVFPNFISSASASFSDQTSPHMFERNPITYLMYAHNCLVNFPRDLNRVLKLISQQSPRPLVKPSFLQLLDRIRNESETKNWLTSALKELFWALVRTPLASTEVLAQQLNTTHFGIRMRIERLRHRFIFNRIIHLNYYRVGLSRVYLFLRFRNRRKLEPPIPVTTRYLEKEIPHLPDTLADLFCIQTYCPPKSRWSNFYALCKDRFAPEEVVWLGGEPRLYLAEDLTILYNTNTYDTNRKKWRVNEDYLAAFLSTGLWQDIPPADLSPTLSLPYEVNTPRRLDFDQLDLKIVHYFYELEGNNNRFSTPGAVAKELGIDPKTVTNRLRRMLKTGMVTFYGFTTFMLPRTMSVILLSETPQICDQFLSIASLLPVSTTARIQSYPSKYVGVVSMAWLPHGSRVPYLFRDFFRANPNIVTGFCAESSYVVAPKLRLWEKLDPVRKEWRWGDLPEQWALPS